MYICLCKGITESAIREAVQQGADRMRDLRISLGISKQCGQCACDIKQILDQTQSQKKQLYQHRAI